MDAQRRTDAAPNRKHRRWSRALSFAAGCVVLVLGIVLSVAIGSISVPLQQIVGAVFQPDDSVAHLVVRTLRLPRALVAGIVGANLAVAGILMQGITGNPLASPSILGVSAGAALAYVSAVIFLPEQAGAVHVAAAFAGAAIAGALVLGMGRASRGSVSPLRMVLAGVAVTAVLTSITQALVLTYENATDQIVFWLAGGVSGRDWADVRLVAPWTGVGIWVAVSLAKFLDVIGLNDDVATGLGTDVARTRLFGGVGVIVLAGAAVAVAGPVAFVGLIVPHIARRIVGAKHRVLIPFAALLGASLLVYADIAARFIAFPYESPAGIVTALIGTPFFLYLARRERGE